MSQTTTADKFNLPATVLIIMALLPVLWIGWTSLQFLADQWFNTETYSHGSLMVLVAAYLAVRTFRDQSANTLLPSRWGLPLLAIFLIALVASQLAHLHVIAHYAIWGVLIALVLSSVGWRGLVRLTVPLALIFLTIPLPGFLESNLTADLKIFSSALGTDMLRMIGIPVFTEGNVIDLGVYQLHVADACSGLNYLFALLALGVMLAGFLETSLWRRIAIVVVAVPLTLLMNVVRITIAGLLVRYVGPETASGFIHDFEGWMVFVLSFALLLAIAALLLRIGPDSSSLREALWVDFSWPKAADSAVLPPAARKNLYHATGLVVLATLVALTFAGDGKQIPQRTAFTAFPKLLDRWTGSGGILDDGVLGMLNLTDYLVVRYDDGRDPHIELFASYYATQTDGATPHSPEVCLPGSGWEITDLSRTAVDTPDGSTQVNRAVVQMASEQMLVYYFFPQRGRVYASEFAMKSAIFLDSIRINRTDGGFIRLTTPIAGSTGEADQRLREFLEALWPILPRYIPGR